MRFFFFDGDKRLRNGWKAIGFFALMAVMVVGLIFARRTLPDTFRRFVPEPHLAFLGAFLASWICLRLEGLPLASLGLTVGRRSVRDFGLGWVGGAGILGLTAVVVWLADGFHLVRTADVYATLFLKNAWTMLAVALFEETIFHGYAFQRAIKGIGPVWAQLVIAVTFCLAHPFGPGMSGSTVVLAMLNIFLAGLMLGLCYLRTGSLALPVGVHMGWNWAMGSLGFAVSGNESKGWWTPVYHGGPEWLTGGGFGLEASVVSVVLLGLAVVALMRWKGSSTHPAERRSSAGVEAVA
ncbi:CPBP family intramembrane glutamic endopeptidase [Vitiosangium sp. GDMCC 1.1324]|uniref:CPBP family intramembrane glutamic endopeptidase n=1 Tax=Vitiosangium sp. (strain GDMCC 1.1324) TaxID=2138576 RepID=UPI000D362BE9|nr:CPBP family intramembrane glutamic endopeptidase [Vitiosangium sp. GDMCC 1.1324]PTL85028.1 hypothetical protein DAT35_08285 [Vitiosangium sp. GDMCC 1.1324]